MSSLLSLFKKFPTEESCIKHLEKIRWGDKPVCPYCQSQKISHHNIEGRRQNWQCQTCTRSFSVTVGTIFHHTHLDLRNWFYILSLMINAKKGLSACQVARDLEMRRTTAWEVMHKIRKAFATEQKELLTGIFEMDETYIRADKSKEERDEDDDNNPFIGNSGRSLKNNTPIVGIKQKSGDIKAFATENTKYYTLGKIAMSIAEVGSEIHTDEYKSYKQFKTFYNHKTVNHSIEYVSRQGVHCNGVESFWALLKRGIKGQFHHISKKYLQRYINEFEYRFNNRFVDEAVVFNNVVNRLLFVRA